MAPQRTRQPPKWSRIPRASLDVASHPPIDTGLKQLKISSRRLQPVLATFSDELHVLHRLFYKGKNEHRAALFWRRVTEMRRYAERVEELALLNIVDSLRHSFFAEESQPTSKALKGSWTHYPDQPRLLFVLERLEGSLTLVQKMHERLGHVYQSLLLAMQSGAFIQLILTLAGVASRMSSLVSELNDVLQQTLETAQSIFSVLNPSCARIIRRRDLRDQTDELPPVPVPVPASVQLEQANEDYEDTGVSISRQDARSQHRRACPPNPDLYTNAAHGNATRTVISTERTVKGPTSAPERHKPKKKKRTRDEIDDIFG